MIAYPDSAIGSLQQVKYYKRKKRDEMTHDHGTEISEFQTLLYPGHGSKKKTSKEMPCE